MDLSFLSQSYFGVPAWAIAAVALVVIVLTGLGVYFFMIQKLSISDVLNYLTGSGRSQATVSSGPTDEQKKLVSGISEGFSREMTSEMDAQRAGEIAADAAEEERYREAFAAQQQAFSHAGSSGAIPGMMPQAPESEFSGGSQMGGVGAPAPMSAGGDDWGVVASNA